MSQSDRVFLRKSQCGSEGRKVFVCCAEHSTIVRTILATKRPETTTPANDETPEAWRESLKGKVPSSPVCGVAAGDRIFGGEIVPVRVFPWAVMIGYKKRKLLTKRKIEFSTDLNFEQLTAA
jgi:hypothetical protein